MVWFQLKLSAFVTVSRSKLSSSDRPSPAHTEYEWDAYIVFAEAMNYALKHSVSNIEVAGFPKFNNHIAFVPCNKEVQSNCVLPGSGFKPDIAVMLIQDAYEFHQLNQINRQKPPEFVARISGSRPPASLETGGLSARDS